MSMSEYVKICPVCGKPFKAICNRKKYCSVECRKVTNKSPYIDSKRKCHTCGKYLADGRHNWCDECMTKYYFETNSSGARQSLIRRGYGLHLTMYDLTAKYK